MLGTWDAGSLTDKGRLNLWHASRALLSNLDHTLARVNSFKALPLGSISIFEAESWLHERSVSSSRDRFHKGFRVFSDLDFSND
jgi:hypothetical protein